MLTDEQYIKQKMDEFKQRHDNKVTAKQPETRTEKKIIIDTIKEIMAGVSAIYNRQGIIKTQQDEMMRLLKSFNKLNVPSQIPYLSPKTIVAMYHRGWTVEQISGISGFTEEQVEDKINKYKNV